MQITVNGETKEVDSQVTILGLLEYEEVQHPEMVAVQHNGTILKRSEFSTTILTNDDTVEFLYFMGGGA